MVRWQLSCECITLIRVQFKELEKNSVVILLFREGRDFLGDLWEQRDPRADRGNAEMCGIKPLSVCYRDAGNTHTLLSEHSISQGTNRRKICKSVATRKIQDESYFVHHCVFVQFRERDELARIFKAWMQPQSSSILISKAWDYRVRQHLGTRYNSKDGSFDWDLNMKLHEKGVFKNPKTTVWCIMARKAHVFQFVLFTCSVASSTNTSTPGGGRGAWPLN